MFLVFSAAVFSKKVWASHLGIVKKQEKLNSINKLHVTMAAYPQSIDTPNRQRFPVRHIAN